MACRPSAYRLFRDCVADLDDPDALLRAAVAIAMHELPDVSPDDVEERIDELAERIQGRVRSGTQDAYVAHLHALLFDEEGFLGDARNYYDARNSYVPCVLDRKRGIPITLTLVYREVARRVGLVVEGVNAPGHFLARIRMDGAETLVDPYSGGRVLTEKDAFQRIEAVVGSGLGRSEDLLRAATKEQWLLRILRNLMSIFQAEKRGDDLRAMHELAELLSAR